MRRISVGKSALTTAVAGSAIVGLVLLLVFAAVSTGHDVLSCEDASSANTTLCPGSMSE